MAFTAILCIYAIDVVFVQVCFFNENAKGFQKMHTINDKDLLKGIFFDDIKNIVQCRLFCYNIDDYLLLFTQFFTDSMPNHYELNRTTLNLPLIGNNLHF